jgi:hypothetical protein
MVANSFCSHSDLSLPRFSFRALQTVVSLLATIRHIYSTLKMEAICSSETSVYKNLTRCHVQEDSIFHSNISSLYQRCLFEFQLGHEISWLRFSMAFLSHPGKCQVSTSLVPWPLPSKSYQFILHQSFYYSVIYMVWAADSVSEQTTSLLSSLNE